MRPNGASFLHHSNLGAYANAPEVTAGENLYWRDPGVDAVLVADAAADLGLSVITQETFRWGTRVVLHDAFSLIVRGEGPLAQATHTFANEDFMQEVSNLARLTELYG